jgi:MinD superfamily P-loop ATPase
MPNSEIEQLKRLIFVYGDKGGVGKSAFARLLLDIYRS